MSATGFFASAQTPQILTQPVEERAAEGSPVRFQCGFEPANIATVQWMRDGVPVPNGNDPELLLENVSVGDRGSYRAHVTLPTGESWSDPVDLHVLKYPERAGSLDRSFHVADANIAEIRAIELLPNGQILIGGEFSEINGIPVRNLARLNADGTLDTTFNQGRSGPDDEVRTILRVNNRTYIGGDFLEYNGAARPYLAKIYDNGSLDPNFAQGVSPNGKVRALELLSDLRLLAGGDFSLYGADTAEHLLCIDSDGNYNDEFAGHLLFNGPIHALRADTSDKILAGGNFTEAGDATSNFLVRLLSTGEVDLDFHQGSGPNNEVHAIDVQYSGHILIGGDFFSVHGHFKRGMARLFPDGRFDESFTADFNKGVLDIHSEPDGSMLVAGDFTRINGTTIRGIARLDFDSVVDETFYPPSVNGLVRTLTGTSTGHAFLGGDFMVPHRGVMKIQTQLPEIGPLAIVGELHPVSVVDGEMIHLSVAVAGTQAPVYHWKRNGESVINTFGPELFIPGATGADAGNYHVTVTDGANTVTSTAVPVVVKPARPGSPHTRTYGTNVYGQLMTDVGANVSTITVNDQFSVSRVRVRMFVLHEDNHELRARLVAPNGATIRLFEDIERRGRNLDGTLFDDRAPLELNEDASPYRGAYRPHDLLSSLVGIGSGGTWTLVVEDEEKDGLTGTIDAWHLELTGEPKPVTYSDWQAYVFDPSQPLQNPNDDYNKDGNANLLSYALTIPPSEPLAPFEIQRIENGIQFEHRRWSESDLVYAYELSSDLQSWRTALPGIDYVVEHVGALGDGREEVWIRVDGAEALYVRLKVGLID